MLWAYACLTLSFPPGTVEPGARASDLVSKPRSSTCVCVHGWRVGVSLKVIQSQAVAAVASVGRGEYVMRLSLRPSTCVTVPPVSC